MKKGTGKYNKKCKFTIEEDQQLRKLVDIYGEKAWDIISQKMTNRNYRQCHDRWFYYLSPSVNTSEWTKDEEERLKKSISEYGKKWTRIARLFPGRNDIQIKNKWSSLNKKKVYKPKKAKIAEIFPVQKEIHAKVEKTPVVEEHKKGDNSSFGIDFSFLNNIISESIELEDLFYC